MAGRMDAARTALSRATVLPFVLRCGIALCGLIAMSVAWPTSMVTSQYSTLLMLVALYPAIAPRGRGATVAALVVVTGWLIDTAGFDSPVALWRVLTIATMLYIGHSFTALAAQMPFDAVVNLDVPGLWLIRTLAVVLVSAVLTVVVLGLSADLAGDAFLAATLVGLAGAVGATILLARLIRRA
jgi:hypothetical protein